MGAGAIPIDIDKAFRDRVKNKHKLHVFIADSSYTDDDCIDVSFHGGHYAFTPPKHLLFDYRLGRINAQQLEDACFEFLEGSFVQYQYIWDEILDRDRLVLTCSCNADDDSCHRHVIIRFLKKFGVVYKGKLKS